MSLDAKRDLTMLKLYDIVIFIRVIILNPNWIWVLWMVEWMIIEIGIIYSDLKELHHSGANLVLHPMKKFEKNICVSVKFIIIRHKEKCPKWSKVVQIRSVAFHWWKLPKFDRYACATYRIFSVSLFQLCTTSCDFLQLWYILDDFRNFVKLPTALGYLR